MNLRSLALMVFIFAASAALAGYVGVKYGDPGSQQQAQHATPPARPVATSRPQPAATTSAPSPSAATSAAAPSTPQASVAPPPPAREAPPLLPSAAETRAPQLVPPPATNTMQLSGSSTAEPPKTTGARDAEAPKCNKEACANAYRSFDAADCTYLPAANSPRRICKR